MDSIFNLKLPFEDPVIVFLIILIFFLFSPLFARKLRMPGIIGLIISGIILGPFGLNLISKDIGINMFGMVGLLYLMFLSGLEINLLELSRYRKQGIIFGNLTFFIPLLFGVFITWIILDMPLNTAILFSSIFSTHTLISYPIISRYGLTRIKISGITIGGTIITDSAVLLLLTIIASLTKGHLEWDFSVRLVIYFIALIAFSVYLLPRAGRWLLARLQGENGYQFIAVLMMVFFTAFLAKFLGIEPIIGAFFAGLALNKLIPQKSPLMNRIVFIGNNLFIPFFLLSVGMIIDVTALLSGPRILIIASLIIITAIISKFLAAYVMQKLFRYSVNERNLMFGLSTSHAAATIAVVIVGYQLQLFDKDLMNIAILLILVSCLVGSMVTERASRKLVLLKKHDEEKTDNYEKAERILVPLSNPHTLENLMSFAFTIKKSGNTEPIYPLIVLQDDSSTSRRIVEFNSQLEKYQEEASSTEERVNPMVRIEVSVVDGILRAVKELIITNIIIGWNGKISASNYILGTLLEKLIEKADTMIMIIKLDKPLENYSSIKLFIPPDIEYDSGFGACLSTFLNFSRRLKREIVFYCEENTGKYLKSEFKKHLTENQIFINYSDWNDFYKYSSELKEDELLIFINARPSFSYQSYLENIPSVLTRYYKNQSFVLAYPESSVQVEESLSTRLGS